MALRKTNPVGGQPRAQTTALPVRAPLLLQWLSLAPIALKGRVLRKLGMWLLKRTADRNFKLLTNLGIPGGFKVALPATASANLLFARPQHYTAERGSVQLAAALNASCDAFVDVGAYLGYYLFFLRSSHRNRMHFLEPNPDLFQQLSQNLTSNRLEDITGEAAAIAARPGNVTFYVDELDDTASTIHAEHNPHPLRAVNVPCLPFYELARLQKWEKALVKVDVENAEFDFLQGAVAAKGTISYLIIEVLLPAVKQGFISTAAKQLGMHPYYICDFELIHSPDGAFHYVPDQLNWLFCRETPDELRKLLLHGPGNRLGRRFKVRG